MKAPTAENIAINSASDGIPLAGTLVRPPNADHAVLLVSGSGAQDRDETVCGQPVLKELARALGNRGIASARFDDRGVGESHGDYHGINADILLADIRKQWRWLRDHMPGVPIGVIGHSQGGLFALRLASMEPVDSIVLLGSPTRDGMSFMVAMQQQAVDDSNLDDDARARYMAHIRELYEAIAMHADDGVRAAAVRTLIERSVAGGRDEDYQPDFPTVGAYVEFAVRDALDWEMRELILSRPGDRLAGIPRSVLALWGVLDQHIDAELERAAFDCAAPRGSTGIVLDGFNHLFQRSSTGRIVDYPNDGAPMQPPVPDIIARWLDGQRPGPIA